MTPSTTDTLDPDTLLRRIRSERGRQMYRLIRTDGLEPREIYETMGRIRALNSVEFLIMENPEPRGDEVEREQFAQLAQVDQELFSRRMDEADGDPDDLGRGVQ